MKTTKTLLTILTLWLGGLVLAQAQGTTAFIYQGRLAEGAAPVKS
jgi:hypothetical protein